MPHAHFLTQLLLSIAHCRIAIAHTAPQRESNSTASVEQFAMEALDRAFR